MQARAVPEDDLAVGATGDRLGDPLPLSEEQRVQAKRPGDSKDPRPVELNSCRDTGHGRPQRSWLHHSTGVAGRDFRRCARTTFIVSMSMVFRTSADAVGVARNAAMTGVRRTRRPSIAWSSKCAGRTHAVTVTTVAPTTVRSIARRMGQSESQRAISGAINIQLSGNSRWSPT